MPSSNTATLEKMISLMINSRYPDTLPSEEEFLATASDMRQRMALSVSDQEFDQILRNLKAALLIAMDKGVCITNPITDHQSWLPSRRADTDFFYWKRYRQYLETAKGWNSRVLATLDSVSDEILDLLGDPKNDKPWKRRGLVLGDVQSGKTANYTAICNKAADTGYKVIIVLAGLTDNLRIQTQERLDKEFAGRLSKHLLQTGLNREIHDVYDGVGKIDKSRQISMFTTVTTDFNSVILNSNQLTLKNINEPALFVVKKNSKILSNLRRWLMENNADTNQKIDMPLLLIDDEADNASVNTKKPEEDPTAVNAAIRSILNSFTRTSYLGITATPFANIFINPETNDEMLGDDLFPRDFIYVLSPPSNYIGADAIYGDDAAYSGCLQELDKDEMNRYFPFKHKKDLVVTELPPSLLEATGYFFLANAIRDVRGDVTEHRSMLVNVSRFTDVQMKIKDLIVDWLLQVRSDVSNYSGLDPNRAMQIRSLKFLRDIWDKYGLSGKAGITWDTLQQAYLHKAIGPIEVRAVNQRTGASSLDYYAHKDDGFRVVAVGGNSLSRGLTLEGLCVSYIYRNSTMYDTLLQMGRWFGYRPNYDDLVKVWMSGDAVDWYGYITAATNELKAEVRRMNRIKSTPNDFGLKVRQDPGSLTVTALNKMRTATPITRPISVQGRLLETPRLKSRPEVLKLNEKAFRLFVANLGSIGHPVKRNRKYDQHLWEGIPKQLVVDLLHRFETHPWHLAFQGPALADFIESSSGLDVWDVVIPNGESPSDFELDGAYEKILIHREMRTIDEVDGMLRVSGTKVRVGSGGCTRAGLTPGQISQAEAEFRRNKPDRRNPSDNDYLIEGRNPLLMLHVIETKQDKKNEYSPGIPETLFAIGLGFPRTDRQDEVARYVVNSVELRNWTDPAEEEDEENAAD